MSVTRQKAKSRVWSEANEQAAQMRARGLLAIKKIYVPWCEAAGILVLTEKTKPSIKWAGGDRQKQFHTAAEQYWVPAWAHRVISIGQWTSAGGDVPAPKRKAFLALAAKNPVLIGAALASFAMDRDRGLATLVLAYTTKGAR